MTLPHLPHLPRLLRVWLSLLAFMVAMLAAIFSTLVPGWLLERYAGLPKWASFLLTLLIVSFAWAWFSLSPWFGRLGAWIVALEQQTRTER